MPLNRHKWQAGRSAETAECRELLPCLRHHAIVTAVAAGVREAAAENAKTKRNVKQLNRQVAIPQGGFAQNAKFNAEKRDIN